MNSLILSEEYSFTISLTVHETHIKLLIIFLKLFVLKNTGRENKMYVYFINTYCIYIFISVIRKSFKNKQPKRLVTAIKVSAHRYEQNF
jgi:hypothetical protein